jgi:hypothetical protein
MVQERMPNFEIPAEMRQMAEQSVEQAKKAFDGFIAAAQQAVSNFEGQAAAAVPISPIRTPPGPPLRRHRRSATVEAQHRERWWHHVNKEALEETPAN